MHIRVVINGRDVSEAAAHSPLTFRWEIAPPRCWCDLPDAANPQYPPLEAALTRHAAATVDYGAGRMDVPTFLAEMEDLQRAWAAYYQARYGWGGSP